MDPTQFGAGWAHGPLTRRIPDEAEFGRQAGTVRIGRIERRPGYRLWIGGPVPPGAGAWTLGSLVIVRRRLADRPHLLAHELEHVQQWREQGAIGFLRRYLSTYLVWRLRGYTHAAAYRRIPAEISAEWRARRHLGIGVGPTGVEAY